MGMTRKGQDAIQTNKQTNKQTNTRAFHIRSDDIQTNKLPSSKLDSTEEKYIKLKRCTCLNPRQMKRTFDGKFSKCPAYDPSTGYVKPSCQIGKKTRSTLSPTRSFQISRLKLHW